MHFSTGELSWTNSRAILRAESDDKIDKSSVSIDKLLNVFVLKREWNVSFSFSSMKVARDY